MRILTVASHPNDGTLGADRHVQQKGQDSHDLKS